MTVTNDPKVSRLRHREAYFSLINHPGRCPGRWSWDPGFPTLWPHHPLGPHCHLYQAGGRHGEQLGHTPSQVLACVPVLSSCGKTSVTWPHLTAGPMGNVAWLCVGEQWSVALVGQLAVSTQEGHEPSWRHLSEPCPPTMCQAPR